jgi:type IV secretory pathway VirB3-like protein
MEHTSLQARRYVHFTRLQLLSGVCVIFVVAVVGTCGVILFLRSKSAPIIPVAIQQHLTFQAYVPNSANKTWTIATKSISYDNQHDVLSLKAVSSNSTVILEEQQTPQVFSNVPQYYPSLMSKLNQYANVSSSLGTVDLTLPSELHGGQTAVLNTSGTLLFARPLHNMSNAQWITFFNDLIVTK